MRIAVRRIDACAYDFGTCAELDAVCAADLYEGVFVGGAVVCAAACYEVHAIRLTVVAGEFHIIAVDRCACRVRVLEACYGDSVHTFAGQSKSACAVTIIAHTAARYVVVRIGCADGVSFVTVCINGSATYGYVTACDKICDGVGIYCADLVVGGAIDILTGGNINVIAFCDGVLCVRIDIFDRVCISIDGEGVQFRACAAAICDDFGACVNCEGGYVVGVRDVVTISI